MNFSGFFNISLQKVFFDDIIILTFKYNRHILTSKIQSSNSEKKLETMTKHTPSACLTSIAITASHLDGAESLEEEFRIIKKVYHEKILKEHPVRSSLL